MAYKFAHTMKKEFEMSMKRELKFFLRLQIRQTNGGIFLNQSKFAKDLVSKFGMIKSKPLLTLISTSEKVIRDAKGKYVHTKMYRSMIGSLSYLTMSKPDKSFSVGVCARHQATLKVSYLKATKRIIRYICGTLNYGLWYPFDINSVIVDYSDADWVKNVDDRKSISEGCFMLEIA